MNTIRRKEAIVLLIGDIFVLFISLYLTITLRYGSLPSQDFLFSHLLPFSILFLVAILINFISGLYEKHTLVLKSKLPKTLTQVQIANTIVSIAFFYFIPYFVITPKITLFMYLVISLVIMVAWRMAIAETLGSRRRYRALLLAQGEEAQELFKEINNNQRYGFYLEWINTSETFITSEQIIDLVRSKKISLVIADFSNQKINEIMPTLYNLIFSGVQFADVQKIYEEIFDRVPLSLVNDIWFLENVSSTTKVSFDIFKRLMDIAVSFMGGLISLIFYPFIYLAIKLDDGGDTFIIQERIGKNNKIIRIKKFRTMTRNDEGKYKNGLLSENKVTRIGSFLRKSRLDELPQFWNVFVGDLALVGPRPELPSLVEIYDKKISYYNMRHIIKPGLFGWAQIYHENHPHHSEAIMQTKEKLSYDFYYIKNRSILLDLKIVLQTCKVLLSFVGR